ncbi:protein FANTASTIC FOUR 1 [Senna tora]|uniref:Protein FANTASTIC FOUR 1 n=1 Tax=Senna tora TaxID=362788 RepID=A0A834TGL2_9FABA|nr:protein FANTASTIC FOUR 1 [Senna tora]
MASPHGSLSGHTRTHSSCDICGIENLFNPPLPPLPQDYNNNNIEVVEEEEGKDKTALVPGEGEKKVLEGVAEEEKKNGNGNGGGGGGGGGRVVVWPPPITCLRNVKKGKPYCFMGFDEETQSYVVDQVNIPNAPFFQASREDGRLKLFFNNNPSSPHDDDDDDDDNDEEN